MSQVVRWLWLRPETIERIQGATSPEVALASEAYFEAAKPLETDPALLAAICAGLRVLHPEDEATIAWLDAPGPRLISVRQARRVGGLLHFVKAKALQAVLPAPVDAKPFSSALRLLTNRFGDCGLHGWGALVGVAQAAVPAPKAATPLALLKAENERLRALLQQHGIDPDSGTKPGGG